METIKIKCPACGKNYQMDNETYLKVKDTCKAWNECNSCLDYSSRQFEKNYINPFIAIRKDKA